MPGIGEDLKEVLQELGSTVYIRRFNGSVFTEKVDFESFPEHSSEFIRQFFNSITLTYDTAALGGDLLELHGSFYIITNLKPSYFEDYVVDVISSIYKCNVLGVLKRETIAVDPVDYIKKSVWAKVTNNPASVHALEYESYYGAGPLFAEDTQSLLRERHVLILPSGLDVKVGDRWYPDYTNTAKFYRIQTIDLLRIPGCTICGLEEDTR